MIQVLEQDTLNCRQVQSWIDSIGISYMLFDHIDWRTVAVANKYSITIQPWEAKKNESNLHVNFPWHTVFKFEKLYVNYVKI